jgi:hypothetical protein
VEALGIMASSWGSLYCTGLSRLMLSESCDSTANRPHHTRHSQNLQRPDPEKPPTHRHSDNQNEFHREPKDCKYLHWQTLT